MRVAVSEHAPKQTTAHLPKKSSLIPYCINRMRAAPTIWTPMRRPSAQAERSGMPFVLPSPYLGLCLAIVVYAIGGGLLEVLLSPIVE